MMRSGRAPSALAARVKSRALSDSVSAGHRRPAGQRHDEDDAIERKGLGLGDLDRHADLARVDGRQDDQERQHGQRDHAVSDAHQHGIEPAAEIARHDADQRADDRREQRTRDADQQRHAAAVEQALEEIAAEIVGAQPVRPARRQQHVEGHGIGVVGRDERPDHRQQRENRQHDRADEGLLIAPQDRAQLRPAGAAPGRDSNVAEDRLAHLS
jgi:hypothetical protein